jgi:hypothetical protein
VVGVAGRDARLQVFAELVREYTVSVQRFMRVMLERLDEVGWEQKWTEVQLSVECEERLAVGNFSRILSQRLMLEE